MKNTGKSYEKFVQSLYSQLQSLKYDDYQKISIKHNKKIIDKFGIERQFDIYWKYEYLGFEYETVIECKDYASTICMDKMDSFIGKIGNIPNLRGIFATKTGYQSGAVSQAKAHGIELLICREQNASDWINKNGEHLLKEIGISFTVRQRAQIQDLQIFTHSVLNGEKSGVTLSGREDEILIEDIKGNVTYSLQDLSWKLKDEHENEFGDFEKEVCFENAHIIYSGSKYVLSKYIIKYHIPKDHAEKFLFDFAEDVLGIIDNISKNRKMMISHNKIFED